MKAIPEYCLGLQIMKDGTINIDNRYIGSALIFAICGEGEGPRSYVTTWYNDETYSLAAHIYISDTLKDQEELVLQELDERLCLCNTEAELLALNGESI